MLNHRKRVLAAVALLVGIVVPKSAEPQTQPPFIPFQEQDNLPTEAVRGLIEADVDVDHEIIDGVVISILELGPGPDFYSDFEVGGIQILLDTDEGPVRVWFGPQWLPDIQYQTFHSGFIQAGDQMMVIGFTAPFNKEQKYPPPGGEWSPSTVTPTPPPPEPETEQPSLDELPFIAQQVIIRGETIRPEAGTPAQGTPTEPPPMPRPDFEPGGE